VDPVLVCSFRFRHGHVFRRLDRLLGKDYRQKLALGICCTNASYLVLNLRRRTILPLLLLQSFWPLLLLQSFWSSLNDLRSDLPAPSLAALTRSTPRVAVGTAGVKSLVCLT
jgi:hypothetical protein